MYVLCIMKVIHKKTFQKKWLNLLFYFVRQSFTESMILLDLVTRTKPAVLSLNKLASPSLPFRRWLATRCLKVRPLAVALCAIPLLSAFARTIPSNVDSRSFVASLCAMTALMDSTLALLRCILTTTVVHISCLVGYHLQQLDSPPSKSTQISMHTGTGVPCQVMFTHLRLCITSRDQIADRRSCIQELLNRNARGARTAIRYHWGFTLASVGCLKAQSTSLQLLYTAGGNTPIDSIASVCRCAHLTSKTNFPLRRLSKRFFELPFQNLPDRFRLFIFWTTAKHSLKLWKHQAALACVGHSSPHATSKPRAIFHDVNPAQTTSLWATLRTFLGKSLVHV